jgi:hypothetical protein
MDKSALCWLASQVYSRRWEGRHRQFLLQTHQTEDLLAPTLKGDRCTEYCGFLIGLKDIAVHRACVGVSAQRRDCVHARIPPCCAAILTLDP